MIKYPKTPRLQYVLANENVFKDWRKLKVVVSEKLDGANAGISFDINEELQLQSRGHILRGGARERQFDMFKAMGWTMRDALFEALSTRYLLFGEWMYAKHHILYDKLPGYFLEYDLYDRESDTFVTTEAREDLLKDLPIPSAPILHRGTFGKTNNFSQYLDKSHVGDTLMEGVYIKVEDNDGVVGRMKVVRPEFEKIRDDDDDWLRRPIVFNILREQ